MQTRHVATAALLLTLALGACGGGSSGAKDSTPTTSVTSTTSAATATTVAPTAVRTDDLERELAGVDRDLGGAQDAVDQSNDTSPDRADD